MKITIPPGLITFTLICFALSPIAQGVVPAPDGGYPGFTTAEGTKALQSLTAGSANTAVGWYSLFSNAEGSFNTATGAGTLLFNTADQNTAFGAAALLLNTTGSNNTAVGAVALFSNTEGADNTALGTSALQNNSTGDDNTAIGVDALEANTTGFQNTALGAFSLQNNVSGVANTAIGDNAGHNVTGSGNVVIGAGMGTAGGEDNHTYIRNINTTTVSGGGADYVTVDLASGLLGYLGSSRRYKENIKPMEKSSEALYRLHPVTFQYKKEIDRSQSIDYGLVAEDVAQIDPNLAIRNGKGQIESVRYNAVNAMLLNEFLKEHREVQEQKATIAQLRSGMEALTATVKEQGAQIQKVSAQLATTSPSDGGLEASKASPQVVNNP